MKCKYLNEGNELWYSWWGIHGNHLSYCPFTVDGAVVYNTILAPIKAPTNATAKVENRGAVFHDTLNNDFE